MARVAAAWVLATCAAVTSAAELKPLSIEDAEKHPFLIHLRGDLLHTWLGQSDEMWAVAMLESDEKCGEGCARIRAVLADVAEKSDGAFRIAWINARESIIGHDGEHVEAHTEFNVTQIPALLIYLPGQKRIETAMRMDTETSFNVLSSGKMLYSNLRQFHPSITASVRAASLEKFLTRPAPALPRLLFLTKDARETPLVIKKVAFDFIHRCETGVAPLSDAALRDALRVPVDANATALFVSPPGPARATALAPETFADWTRYTGEMKLPALQRWLHATLPATPVPLLLSQADFDTHCGTARDANLCFIAMLQPQALRDLAAAAKDSNADDDDAHTGAGFVFRRVVSHAYVKNDIMTYNGGDMRAERLPIAFMAVDASAQTEFVQALGGVTPGLVALNPRKRMAALYRGAFTDVSVVDFVMAMVERAAPTLEGLPPRRAEVTLTPLATLPRVVTQSDPRVAPPKPKSKTKAKKPKATAAAAPLADADSETADKSDAGGRDEL